MASKFQTKMQVLSIIFCTIIVIGMKAIANSVENSVSGHRKGNYVHHFFAIRFEFFKIPFSIFAYYQLTRAFKSFYDKRQRSKKFAVSKSSPATPRCFSFIVIVWLIQAHTAFLLYYFSNVNQLFFTVFLFSGGLWYHLVLILFAFYLVAVFLKKIESFVHVEHAESNCLIRSICSIKNDNIRVFFCVTLAVLLSVISFISCDKVIIKERTVYVNNLPHEADGFRFASVSDLHTGGTVGRSEIMKIVDRIDAENVDAVFLVGDIVDAPRDEIFRSVEPLRFLNAKYGTYLVTGNHEYYYGNAEDWLLYFKSLGINVFRNNCHRVSGICIAGVYDYSSGKSGVDGHVFDAEQALNCCSQNQTVIVLSHNPSSAKKIAFNSKNLRADLIISGHTHAGQYYTLAPIAFWFFDYFYGFYDVSNKTQILVSSGALYQFAPMKMVGMSEIWVITLRSKI